MKTEQLRYRKNFLLIIVFMVLISVSLIVALFLGYNFTRKYVENEFSSKKIEVLEQTIAPYNSFFQNAVPEVSFYQGYLDSASASKYADSVLQQYRFVDRIIFYDAQISNRPIEDGLTLGNFSLGIKKVFRYGRNISKDSIVIFDNSNPGDLSLNNAEELNKAGLKLGNYIEQADTTQALSEEIIFKTFYNINPNRITYMNVPRREEIKVYKDLMLKKQPLSPRYQQDIFTFELNPYQLVIKNPHPEIYQFINIRKQSFDPILEKPNLLTTDISLSGPFADYKLYFASEKDFLIKEVGRRFMPIAFGVFFIYCILALITFLIYRNLNINQKLFKLQYDFINNFTHEFKTPVSVIKIAGNNIKSAKELSEREKNHYGKILDEEADRLNDLMNRLLSFTQIENRAIKLKNEEINLEIFAQNIIDSFQIKYADYEIDLSIEGVETFKSDPLLLGSLFDNLIENAYKYANPGSKFLKISIYKSKKNIIFSFEDKGIGIDRKEIKNIFKKFYRIQSQYNQQGSVGLGLAFCKELVNFMDGDITVTSKPGIGSHFKITLPYDR
jgi:two-component system phosphate regulon sensor histidine kinase PhoR